MIKTYIFSLVLFLSIASCNYVDNLFKKDVKRIDFTSVDEYPTFPTCDSIQTVDYKQSCFEKTVSEYIYTDLLLHEFSAALKVSDAIIIHIVVDLEGKVNFLELESSANSLEANSELTEVIKESIANFPKITPAKKRGVYVNSKFMIPLYIVN
jgi:hypothetical protein